MGPLLHQPYVMVTGLLEVLLPPVVLGPVPPQALNNAPPTPEASATLPACLRKLLRFNEETIVLTPSCIKMMISAHQHRNRLLAWIFHHLHHPVLSRNISPFLLFNCPPLLYIYILSHVGGPLVGL